MRQLDVARKIKDHVFTVACAVSVLCALLVLGSIFSAILSHGLPAFHAGFLTQDTPVPDGTAGGLRNAIFGSFVITLMAVLLAAPIGVLAATYLSHYGRRKRTTAVIRFMNDVWLSAPSITVGLFVYIVLVRPTGHYSAFSGAVALALIACPIITRSAEDVLNLVPKELREAAIALGVTKWKVIVYISWRAAKQGIITGILLAIARITGETAPLLFTVLNNRFWSTDLNAPIANLPVTIYQFAMSPYENWQNLAWGGALFITVVVLFFNILIRYLNSLGRTYR